MGCDEIKTEEYYDQMENSNNNFQKKPNLCLKMYSGVLQSDINFTDTLIRNQNELEDKLRSFIPTKIIKDDSEVPTFNTKDDILTNSAKINFAQHYLIAINGVNRVLRVEEENGNYLIYHDNQAGSKDKYLALVVTQIGVDPHFFYATPKKPF